MQTVSGRVVTVSATGAIVPVVGVRVSLVGDDLRSLRTTRSGQDGRFVMTRVPGVSERESPRSTYELIVQSDFQPPAKQVIAAEALSVPVTLSIPAPEPYAETFQIQVSDCQGAPVSRALIQLNPPLLNAIVFTDNSGQATLPALPEGLYTVFAAKGQGRDASGVVLNNLETLITTMKLRLNPRSASACDG